ncbi:MAG: hypothetical protein WBL63_16170 [Candidatus Acidiferrum sp.]
MHSPLLSWFTPVLSSFNSSLRIAACHFAPLVTSLSASGAK